MKESERKRGKRKHRRKERMGDNKGDGKRKGEIMEEKKSLHDSRA